MLDPRNDASWTETHRQSFSIDYNYPVYFTRDLFDPANPCLAGALSAVEPEKRHRFAISWTRACARGAILLTRIAAVPPPRRHDGAGRRYRGGSGWRVGQEPA